MMRTPELQAFAVGSPDPLDDRFVTPLSQTPLTMDPSTGFFSPSGEFHGSEDIRPFLGRKLPYRPPAQLDDTLGFAYVAQATSSYRPPSPFDPFRPPPSSSYILPSPPDSFVPSGPSYVPHLSNAPFFAPSFPGAATSHSSPPLEDSNDVHIELLQHRHNAYHDIIHADNHIRHPQTPVSITTPTTAARETWNISGMTESPIPPNLSGFLRINHLWNLITLPNVPAGQSPPPSPRPLSSTQLIRNYETLKPLYAKAFPTLQTCEQCTNKVIGELRAEDVGQNGLTPLSMDEYRKVFDIHIFPILQKKELLCDRILDRYITRHISHDREFLGECLEQVALGMAGGKSTATEVESFLDTLRPPLSTASPSPAEVFRRNVLLFEALFLGKLEVDRAYQEASAAAQRLGREIIEDEEG
ncbi:hypothetical protein P7C73_g4447, partial [Tremellales sp. Uapishka_1]